jgi:L-erythro-3,5-diaminohexanoate dehydrogenase
VIKEQAVRGDDYGIHRVIEPRGVLPQAAWRLDNDASKVFDDEIVLDVERLNIDSASFQQMREAGDGDVAAQVLETVRARGKQHNPVTGSGGMLLGRVARVGSAVPAAAAPAVGERVATLVSLTLTPLHLERLLAVDEQRHQVTVVGKAIVFASSAWARLPDDLPETAALAALDVAGAAPQVERAVAQLVAEARSGGATPSGRGVRVLVLGCGGKSGLLASAAARRAGATIVVGVERSAAAAASAHRLGACDHVAIADAADALAVARAATSAAGGTFDFTVSCVNVPDAEMGAILATRDGGVIYFFSMSTSFTKAALGAEGVSRDVTMLIGNGYAPGHAEATLALLRADARLRELFVERYG